MSAVDLDATPLISGREVTDFILDEQDTVQFYEDRAPKFLGSFSLKMVLSLLLLIVSGTCNSVSFKVMTNAFYFKIDESGNRVPYYTTFISQFTTFIFIPIFWMVVWYFELFTNRMRPEVYRFPTWKYAVMGLFDAVAGTLMVCGAMKTSGIMQQVLGQATIPFTMLFTILASIPLFKFRSIGGLNTRYKWTHFFGVLLIICGMAFAFIPHTRNPSVVIGTQIAYVILYFTGFIPSAISSVFKEICFKNYDLDIYLVNAWDTTYQFFIGFPSLFFYALILDDPMKFIRGLPADLWNGTKCFFGVNTLTAEGITENLCATRMPWLHTMVFVVFNFFYNVAYMLVLKYGSATLVQIASAIILPLADLCFNFGFIMNEFPDLPSSAIKCKPNPKLPLLSQTIPLFNGISFLPHPANNTVKPYECDPKIFNDYKEPLNLYNIGSLIIILLGMYFYQINPEEDKSSPN